MTLQLILPNVLNLIAHYRWQTLLLRATTVGDARSELLVLVHTIATEFDATTAVGAPMRAALWRETADQVKLNCSLCLYVCLSVCLCL